MRKQYYFRPSSRGLLAWDVDRLVQLSNNLARTRIPLSKIRELDEIWSGEDEPPTGMHRVAKAAWQGRKEIDAVQFDEDPEPDHVGLGPTELPY